MYATENRHRGAGCEITALTGYQTLLLRLTHGGNSNKDFVVEKRLSIFCSFLPFLTLGLFLNVTAQLPDAGIKVISAKELKSDPSKPLRLNIPLKKEFWDMSDYTYVSAEVTNLGKDTIRVTGFLNEDKWVDGSVRLTPNQTKTLQIFIRRSQMDGDAGSFQGMFGKPGGYLGDGYALNNKEVKLLTIVREDKRPANISIGKIMVGGPYTPPAVEEQEENAYPLVDKYGQNIKTTWPGKVVNDQQLRQAISIEKKELEAMPMPVDFNRFGGFKNGPKLTATGRFRVEKYKGKWWFVDPDGSLFWSHGATCVTLAPSFNTTVVGGREKFFDSLPPNDQRWRFAYSSSNGKTTFNPLLFNLSIKYGEQWNALASENILKRFKSWGLNSMGNWSDPTINKYGNTPLPFFMNISPQWPKLDGKDKKFPDVFDSSFITSLRDAIGKVTSTTRDDPFCIGYFIDNELSVGNLTVSLMQGAAGSSAKKGFTEFLKNQYATIAELNNAWKTRFTSWTNFDTVTTLPEGAIKDMRAFDLIIIEKYYQTCKTLLKNAAPNSLYLGSRLHCHYYPDDQGETSIIKIAAKYCDVVSFNRYRFIASDLTLPDGIDKPSIIGEFHFGALDRGMIHPGLRSVSSQLERAEAYEDYVTGALENSQIIGTHWFQYLSQPFTGRYDGENYQVGIVDICDNPYPELVKAIRSVGYKLYQTRLSQ